MKIKTLATLMVGLGLSITAANAAHVWEDPSGWWDNHFITGQRQALFSANEVSLDLFGSYMAAERGFEDVFKTNIRHGDWGGGVGLNYFFTRELGIGVDINMPDNGGNLIDTVGGNLIARLPWESGHMAPYIFGGGGRMTDPTWQWFLQAGVGLEIRINHLTGIFIDARYVWADDAYENAYNTKYDGDQALFRAGLRLVF